MKLTINSKLKHWSSNFSFDNKSVLLDQVSMNSTTGFVLPLLVIQVTLASRERPGRNLSFVNRNSQDNDGPELYW